MAARRISQGVLSDIEIRNWMRAGEPVAKSDGGGLTFTLSKAGTASWALRYSLAGRRREMTLGNYPDMSLSEARKFAREKRVEVDKGISPADEKRRTKIEALNDQTVTAVINDYKAKILPALSAWPCPPRRPTSLARVKKAASRTAPATTGWDVLLLG